MKLVAKYGILSCIVLSSRVSSHGRVTEYVTLLLHRSWVTSKVAIATIDREKI